MIIHLDTLWINARLARFDPAHTTATTPYGESSTAMAVGVKDGIIQWLGRMDDLSKDITAHTIYDVKNRWITPAFIDCHTHIVYAGNRASEFEARLSGKTYAQIAAEGGGIQATVTATRAASEEELFALTLPRVQHLIAQGVTTLEIKSGYGLTTADEAKMLRVARRIGHTLPLDVTTTFLGAHTVPPEFIGRADDYLDLLIHQTLPALISENLVDAVDAFCEPIAFSQPQVARLFTAATQMGLPVKCHAEQLSSTGASRTVAQFNGLSADHLEYLTEDDIAQMAAANTVAVLLPSAYYYLRETQTPPIQNLRQYGVAMALASDCNPGTSPSTDWYLILNMACTLFGLTPAEAWAGVTRHAAQALGKGHSHGQLATGYHAHLLVWDFDHPRDLCYTLGAQAKNPLWQRVWRGQVHQIHQ